MAVALVLTVLPGLRCKAQAQAQAELRHYLTSHVGLSEIQIKAVRGGDAVAKARSTSTRKEVLVSGAVWIDADPEAYVRLATDLERLKRWAGYLEVRKFSTPPVPGDLNGFTLDDEDITSLRNCKSGDCPVQMPERSMEIIQQFVETPEASLAAQVNALLQDRAWKRLVAYQREGNAALGVYNDKEQPTDVARQFQSILGQTQLIPEHLPELYKYLLAYPLEKPANAEDLFYWARVRFGLKPTLRMVHVVVLRGMRPGDPACVIAEQQIYASHYFQAALDMSLCLANPEPAGRGFYLIKTMGSEQAGLTGLKGLLIRKSAVQRSAAALQKMLADVKKTLESGR